MLPAEEWLRSLGRIIVMIGAVLLGLWLVLATLTHSSPRPVVQPCPVLKCGPCDNCAPEPHEPGG